MCKNKKICENFKTGILKNYTLFVPTGVSMNFFNSICLVLLERTLSEMFPHTFSCVSPDMLNWKVIKKLEKGIF